MSRFSSFIPFAARLREFILWSSLPEAGRGPAPDTFDLLAMDLFALQFAANPPYRKFCEARGATPREVEHWTRIPALPAASFKDFDLSCLPPGERSAVFHSSGTTGHRPSRHFHGAESLALYEASLLPWFARHVLGGMDLDPGRAAKAGMVCLVPPKAGAPHSSLVYMFDAVARRFGAPEARFVGVCAEDGWRVDAEAALNALRECSASGRPVVVLGTAFSFVHLLDAVAGRGSRVELPAGSRVMETGGYKGRSRAMPKAELHRLISRELGVAPESIVCEYGMSELSSQGYDRAAGEPGRGSRTFRFPPWAGARVISPETGREAAEGKAGLIQVLDLANAFSVMSVQTEDLGVRRGGEFELLGRAALSEPRGCSLQAT